MVNKKEQSEKEISLMDLVGKQFIPNDVEEILEREVVGIGTGAHINIPKKHIGKHARVIIKRGEDN